MKTAMLIVAISFFLFVALATMAVVMADRAGDNYVVPAILFSGLALFCLVLELVLAIAYFFTH